MFHSAIGQWIGLREILQENPMILMGNQWFPVKILPRKPIFKSINIHQHPLNSPLGLDVGILGLHPFGQPFVAPQGALR
jgi:hypothetical protein